MRTKRTNGARSRALLLAAVLLASAGLGTIGWRWYSGMACRAVKVEGARYAEPGVLIEMARVDTGMVLHLVDEALVEDRVRRHPWVRNATLRRLPNATLVIQVDEREPALMVIGEDGQPSHFLDPDGYQMPLADGAVYDVPLLYGLRAPYNPVLPVEDEAARTLAAALAISPPDLDGLISEFERDADGEIWLYTTPYPGHGAVRVRLGKDQFETKFTALLAFWRQAVLTRPEAAFDLIDLRFDSQVITRETRTEAP